jgi:hypothetical protein
VAANYSAYTLDRLGADAGTNGTGLSAPQAVILALLIGAGLGLGLVAAELHLRSAFAARTQDAAATPLAAYCRATTSKGTPCRNRPLDERGYCRMHLDQADEARAGGDGSSKVIRLGEPTPRSLAPDDRRQPRFRREDEA